MSASSLACCCANNNLDISEILRRITPIDYYAGFLLEENENCPSQNGYLLVNSNQYIYGQLAFASCDGLTTGTIIDGSGISANTVIAKDTLYVGNTQITSNGSILELPCGTTVCGVPIGGGGGSSIFNLTVCPTNGQQTNLPITSAGDYIVGGYFQNGYLGFVQYVYYWPCLFMSNSTITSFGVYLNVATGTSGLPITATNLVAELRIRKQDGTIIATGQTATYGAGLANNTSYFFGVEGLSYNVDAGWRAGIYLSWTGQLATDENYNYSWTTYNIAYQPR